MVQGNFEIFYQEHDPLNFQEQFDNFYLFVNIIVTIIHSAIV